MLTDVQIINNGLSKIAASSIRVIDPPRTQIEQWIGPNYKQWKQSELQKRRWVFALVDDYQLTATETLVGKSYKYKLPLPIDCLKPLHGRIVEWRVAGKFIYSNDMALKISYIRNAPESDFDPLFIDVLAARIAYESAEYITQSSTKKADALALYNEAVRVAGQMNAYLIGPEEVTADERAYGWESARHV